MFAASKTGKAAAAAATDNKFNYVTMLLHGDGTNGAQNNTFIDSSSNAFTVTRNGSATQGSFSPYGTLWSNYFTSGNYLTFGTNSAFDQTGDFTIECWAYFTAVPTGTYSNHQVLFSQDTTNAITLGTMNTMAIAVTKAGYGVLITGSTILSLNTWYHIAVVRSGSGTNNLKLYVNGILDGQITHTNSVTNTSTVFVGRDSWTGDPAPMQGYISNCRYVKDTAVYTSGFTPSTTPLTAITNTSLLTCQSNRFKDNSTNNFTVTANGSPSVQRFSPFEPSAAYSSATTGGSMYYSSAASASAASSSSTVSGDFTAECWVYPTAYPNDCYLVYLAGTVTICIYNGTLVCTWGGGYNGNGFGSIKLNAWSHLAVSRSSGTIRLFINGVQTYSYANTSSNTGTMQVGDSVFTRYVGYVSDARLMTGTALYTSNFTPPTAPLSAVSGTSLLLNMTNAGIYDSAAQNDLITVGDAQISTSVVKYGTGSLKFDGSGDYLKTTETLPFDMGSSNFTAECWAYPTSTQTGGIFRNANSGSFGGFGVAWSSSRFTAQFSYTGSSWGTSLSSTNTFSLNQWYHLALVRNGTTVTLYVNGVAEASTSLGTNSLLGGQPLYIGWPNWSTEYFTGYIDDLRITKGYARYTANFTPPTAALPDY